MATAKDFRVARREAEREPLTFTLGYDDGPSWTFTTKTILPAGPLLELALHGDESGTAAFGAYHEFLLGMIPADQHAELRDALRELEWLDVLPSVRWLISEMTARPFDTPSDSPSSPPTNGELSSVSWTPTSEEASSS